MKMTHRTIGLVLDSIHRLVCGRQKTTTFRMTQHKEKCSLLYTISMIGHLKCTCFNTSNVNANALLGLFHDALSIAVVM
jgi:hypothetical protein